jgi:hypothetical protein
LGVAGGKISPAQPGLNNTAAMTCEYSLQKIARFGRKTGVSGELFNTFFRGFSIFGDSPPCKSLPLNNQRASHRSKKNRA